MLLTLNKQTVIESVVASLEADLALALSAADNARDTATSKENIAENKYDTLGLEAAYLAHGQSNRAQRLVEERAAFSALVREPESETVTLGSLVCIAYPNHSTRWLLVGPGAAGLNLSVADEEIVVVTPDSPLGKVLWGLSLDDTAVFNGEALEVIELN